MFIGIPLIIFWDHFYTVKILKQEYYKRPYRPIFGKKKKPKKLKRAENPEEQPEAEGEGEQEPDKPIEEKIEEKPKAKPKSPPKPEPSKSEDESSSEGEESEESRSQSENTPKERQESDVSDDHVNTVFEPLRKDDISIDIDPADVMVRAHRQEDIDNAATGVDFGGFESRKLQKY